MCLAEPRRIAQQLARTTALGGDTCLFLTSALLFLVSLLRGFALAPSSFFNADEERAIFEERLAAEASASASVPEADDSRHPLIVRARRKHPDPSALRFEITVSDALRERALRLAAGLVNACESRGYRFERRPDAAEGVAAVNVFEHLVGLAIEEPPRRVPHVLTKKEEREKAVGRGWNIPEHDTVPSGELVILLHHDADGERRSFAATKERDIEVVLPDVMKALLKIAMRRYAFG